MFPANDLERAFAGALRGAEWAPELYRQLCQSVVAFLMPYHPEIEGMMELRNGQQLDFCVWEEPKGRFIPLFTSMERAEQALKAVGARENQYALAEMPGEYLFKVIATQEYGVVINPACKPGQIFLTLETVKGLADGSILKPIGGGPGEHRRARIVEPADYPTDLVQPLFQFLRQWPEVRAAWLFRDDGAPAPPTGYLFGLLLKDEAAATSDDLRQTFAVVAKQACGPNLEFSVNLLDPKNPQMAAIIAEYMPFYAAPDYRPPAAPA